MLKYKLQGVDSFKKEYLKGGVFLVLLNALKVPPHLLLVVSGKVFSISTLGPSLDESVERYLNFIHKRRIPSVFVKLALPPVFTQEELLGKIRTITSSYPRVDIGVATCLNPIKDFCSDIYDVDKHQVNLVFDLLDGLKQQKAIEAYYQINMDEVARQGEINLEKYSVFEVNEAIHGAAVS